MAINRFNDYTTTKSYSDTQQLPKGGYVAIIKNAEVCSNSYGQYVRLYLDIVEGEFAGYFTNDYKSQTSEDKKWRGNYILNVPNDDGSERDGWTKRRFKTCIEAIEESNPGYHFDWDEQKFKNKRVGILVNEREYLGNDGSIRKTYNIAALTSEEHIKTGKFTLPKDRLIDRPRQSSATTTDEFIAVPDGAEDDGLPF